MSAWNRIGQFAKDIGGAVAAPARFAWDIATSPWNDDEHFNGVANTLASATKNLGTSLIKPVADIASVPVISQTLEGINKVNQELIREPLATAALAVGDTISGKGSIFDPNEWKRAYKGAQDISFGQAALGAVRDVYDKDFNIYDPEQRKQAFETSTFGRYASGLTDTALQFTGDVTLGLAKGVKVLKASEYGVGAIRNADDAVKAAEGISKAQFGETNRFTKVIADFTNGDSIYALSHPMVKSSHEPGLLANLLGNSKDADTTAEILRSALGDSAALADLELRRPDITQALNAANQKLDAVDKFKIKLKEQFGEDMVNHLWEDPDVVREAKAALVVAGQADAYVAKLMKLGAGGGSLTRTTGTTLQGVEDFVAKARAVRFYDKPVGQPVISFFQQTPFHRMYQVISHAEHERPAGLVDLNDADSYKEIVATIDRARKLAPDFATEAVSKAHLDRYIGAVGPEARGRAAYALEQDTLISIAAKHGLNEQQAMEIWQEYHAARTSAVKSIKEETFMVDHDKSIVKAPVFESQTANNLPMMDFDLMNRLLKRHGSSIATLGRTKDTIVHYADILQDAFKAAALLRGGYTIRNGIDSQLRIIASVGAMASIRHLGEGMSNIMFDRIPVPRRMVDGFKFVPGKTIKVEAIAKARDTVKAEITALESQIKTLDKQIAINPNDAGAITEVGTLKNLLEEKQNVYIHHADTAVRLTTKGNKARLGEGFVEHTTSDGKTYQLYDAFGGPLGGMFRTLNSSSATFQRLLDTNSDLLGRKLSSKGTGVVKPEDIGYHNEWANTLNTDFANSQAIRMLAKGDKPEDVIGWLKNDPAGQEIRKRMLISYSETDDYVHKINGFLDNYLPAENQLLRDKLARREKITGDELAASTAGKAAEDLPAIHGNVLKENINNNSLLSVKSVTDNLFKFLGSMPEDAWARHPLYRELYRDELKRRLDIVSEMKKDRLTPAEQEAVMAKAHDFAQGGVKKILFNIERRTNLATYLKYVSPFFSAQENAVKTWTRIGLNNPVIINRANIIWNAPNRAGLVTDQEGNKVEPGKSSPNDIIWLEVPGWAKHIPFLGAGLSSLTQQGIPKQSLDIIFGGGLDVLLGDGTAIPFNDIIPIGPYVAIPASEIVKNAPEFEDCFKWALPFGPNSGPIYEGLMPAWMKRAQTLLAGQNSQEYARTFQLIHTTEIHEAKRLGKPIPSDAEIKSKTDNYYRMRVVANLILPYSPRFDSPYRLYLDKYREYQRTLGVNADATFLKDFGPDFFDFATSLSSNKTGALATQGTYKNTRKYADLVASVFQDDPNLVGLITNNKTGTDFSQAVYDWQYNTSVGPGTGENFRTASNAQDAENQNKVKLGWIQYRNVMNQVDVELEKRGLTSTNQRGAEDLQMIKQSVVETLAYEHDTDGNPVLDAGGNPKVTPWFESYNDPQGSKIFKVLSGLTKITTDAKFMKDQTDKNGNLNPTWKSVLTYLEIRKQLASELAGRKSKTITAKANADVFALYQTVVGDLKTDAGFADLYDRYLSQDQVYYKYISEAAQGA